MVRPNALKDILPHDRASVIACLQGLGVLAAFIAAVGFNGTSDPLIALFMPVLFGLAGLSLWHGTRQGWQVPKSATVLFLVLFWLYLVLSLTWSSVVYISVMFVVLIGTLPLMFFTVTMARDPVRTGRALMAGLALGWIGLAVWALLQFYVFPETKGHRISAPMLDPNNLAALFNMGMLIAATCFLAARKRLYSGLALAAYILMCLGTMVTMSRAGLVIAMASAALMLALQSRHIAGQAGKAVLYALVPPLAYGLVNFSSGNRFAHTFSDLENSAKSPSVIDRRSLLEGSWRMLTHHPFGDIGLGNFYYFYPAYRSQSDMSDGFFAHIDPLQLTLETGLPVTILLYAFLIAVLVRTIRAWRRLPAGGTARTVMAGAFVALLSLIVHSHINYNLYMPGILIPAGVLLGVWYLASEKAAGMDARIMLAVPPRRRTLAACGLVLLLFTAALWPFRAGIASYYINRANAMMAQGDDEGASRILKHVARYGIRENFSIYEAQGRIALQRLNGPRGADARQRAETIKSGMTYMQEARRHNPAFSTFMSLEAQFYFLGNETVFPDGLARAQPLLEQAVAANPLDVDAREGLSIVYQARQRPEDALRVLNEGLNWPRTKGRPDIDFLMITARAHEAAGDHDGAKLLVDTASQRAQTYGLPLQP